MTLESTTRATHCVDTLRAFGLDDSLVESDIDWRAGREPSPLSQCLGNDQATRSVNGRSHSRKLLFSWQFLKVRPLLWIDFAMKMPWQSSSRRLLASHVDEAGIVALESHGDRRGRAVAVLGDDEVGLAGAR